MKLDGTNNTLPQSSKTVETMFRIASSNSQRLSDQADTKSNIMITVNAISLSVLVAFIVRYQEWQIPIVIPLFMLVFVNVFTIVFATLATRPCIPKGEFKLSELRNKTTNLLFFGNFYRTKFEDYSAGMLNVMSSKTLLYHSLLRDIYCQGLVLGKKYKMLEIAYTIFLTGVVICALTFIIVFSFAMYW